MSFYVNFGVVNEGDQADAYKWRKHKAAEDEKRKDNERIDKRYYKAQGPGSPKENLDTAISRSIDAVDKVTNREDMYDAWRMDSPKHGKYLDAVDSTKRHMRRHPEAYKEFGIFAESCFIDD